MLPIPVQAFVVVFAFSSPGVACVLRWVTLFLTIVEIITNVMNYLTITINAMNYINFTTNNIYGVNSHNSI
jgi:hypothetical protein